MSVQSGIIALWVAGSDAIGKQLASDLPANVTTISRSNTMRAGSAKRDEENRFFGKIMGNNTPLPVQKLSHCEISEYS
jgi:hypothetical protein